MSARSSDRTPEKMTTALISHPSCRRHDMGPAHPERPQRLDVITDMLMTLRLLDLLAHHDAPRATRAQLLRTHTPGYLDWLEAIVPETGYRDIDLDTRMTPKTPEAALRAAGAAVLATDLVLDDEVENAFCPVRPPGHHATANKAMGFCFFNNVAVAAAHALAVREVERVAIIDFDVHHGNGTDEIFEHDDRVLFCSLFQTGLFPLTDWSEPHRGGVYVPLAGGDGGEAMRAAVERTWRPALDAFQPRMVFVSAGFDAHVDDDISELAFSDADFQWLTEFVLDIARRHADGRLVSVLEGGYDLPSLARCAGNHVKLLSGL
jgi:acetoin utilization deacetylase AcuC-like enzyme